MQLSSSLHESREAPQLSTYTDYRQYLNDFYRYKKYLHANDRRSYSYAVFAARADIKSPMYLKLIIEGQRNLSDEMAQRFAKALGLTRGEADEFCALVSYNQESEPMRRNQYLKQLSDLRIQNQIDRGEINIKTWETVPNWITWVLTSLIDQEGVEFSPQRLQELFRSKVNASHLEDALARLLETGQIAKHPDSGEMRKNRILIEAPESVPVALIRKLQAELIYLGIESLYRDEPTEREFGALTMALTTEEFEQVKFELRQLKKRLNRDFAAKREVAKGDQVYQLNIQFFPMTKKVRK